MDTKLVRKRSFLCDSDSDNNSQDGDDDDVQMIDTTNNKHIDNNNLPNSKPKSFTQNNGGNTKQNAIILDSDDDDLMLDSSSTASPVKYISHVNHNSDKENINDNISNSITVNNAIRMTTNIDNNGSFVNQRIIRGSRSRKRKYAELSSADSNESENDEGENTNNSIQVFSKFKIFTHHARVFLCSLCIQISSHIDWFMSFAI